MSFPATGAFAAAHVAAPSVVAPGDMLMLMVHAETGGMETGIFEYTLGAKEDGPIKIEGNLVMKTITVVAE